MAQLKKKGKKNRKQKQRTTFNPRHPFVIVKALNFMFPLQKKKERQF